jgi:hypothetical protein
MNTTIKNFSKLLLVAITIFSMLIISSCSKDNDELTPPPPSTVILPTSDVFVVGADNGSPSQEFYYKNNIKTNLAAPPELSSSPNGIYVSGEDVYVYGNVYGIPSGSTITSSYWQACYWKNNVKVNLPYFITGDVYANVVDMTVVNGDVYALGVFANNIGANRQIVVWKNGVLNYITTFSATNTYFPTAICVYNNDIYVSGLGGTSASGSNRAKYWKNGIETTLSTVVSICNDIHVDQTGIHVLFDEYAAGSSLATAVKYWKDGITTTISTQSPGGYGKMFVKGTDVFITGSETETSSTISKACYWKNGTKTELAGGNTLVAAYIKVGANGDVFVLARNSSGGNSREYWKNNVKGTLGAGNEFFKGFDINNK